MKYYNLPSAEQIACYHNGTLTIQDKQWIEAVMQKNPFVKEAVNSFSASQLQSIQQISERVGTRIKNQHLAPRGFWSKYGVWIGLSTIALLLVGGYFLTNNAEQRYFQEDGNQHVLAVKIDQEGDMGNKNTSDIQEISALQNEKTALTKENTDLTEGVSADKTIENVSGTQSNEQITTDDEQTKSTTNLEKEEINLSGKLLKSVRGITLVNIDKGGLKRREIPEFPGGNIGLTNHFQGYITPVELQYGEKIYDAKSQIILEIGANGKLKSHEIQGELHESHAKQVHTAIEKLPQFKPGIGDAVFTIEVKFN